MEREVKISAMLTKKTENKLPFTADMLIMLIPFCLLSVYFYGLTAVKLIFTSIITAIICDFTGCVLLKKETELSDLSAVNTGIASVITNASKAETEDTTLKKTVSIPCPKWEIYLDKAEQYRFRLYAPNGLIVCHSAHGYATKGGCKGGIESIKRFASEEASIKKSYLNKD